MNLKHAIKVSCYWLRTKQYYIQLNMKAIVTVHLVVHAESELPKLNSNAKKD